MTLWEQALAHLVDVAEASPLASMIEPMVLQIVEHELDKGAAAVMRIVEHWATAAGVPVPVLGAQVPPAEVQLAPDPAPELVTDPPA